MIKPAAQSAADYPRRLVEQLPSILAYWGADQHCRYANPAYAHWFGADPQALVGMALVDLLGPDLHALEEPRFRAALAGIEQTFEGQGAGPDGALRQGLLTYIPDRIDGVVVGVAVQGFDISTYKRAEEARQSAAQALEHQVQSRTAELQRTAQALQWCEGRLRGLFESTVDAIITVGEELTVTSANQAAARMFGSTVDDMVGTPLEHFIPQRFRDAHAGQMRQFGDSGVPVRPMGAQREILARRADGTEFPVEASISHVQVAGQRLYTVLHRDITERKRAEAALLASKTMLETTLASMADGMIVCDAEGRVVELNDAFVTLARFADKPTCLQKMADYSAVMDVRLPSGEALAREQWPMARALRGEQGSGVEYLMVRKDTGESWFGSCSFSPRNGADGSPAGAVLTVRDITPLKQAQAELELSHADLQRLIAARDEVQEIERKRIARELHDDLQQKLASIRLKVSQARQGAEAGDARIPALLDEIDNLNVTAIESNRRIVNDLQPQLLEDLGLVPALEALLRQFKQQTGIQARLQQPDGDLSAALQSPGLSICLFRVVQEALNNVGKHAQAREVEVQLGLASPDQLRLRVMDNGVGMLDSDRRKARSFGLLGMRERVRAFGGQLRLESRPDQGTDLEVTVPLPKAAERAPR